VPAVIALVTGLLLVSATLGAVAASVRNGHLGRNQVLGIRTKRTLHCDECWAVGHRASVPDLRRALWVGLAAAGVSAALAVSLAGQSWGEGVAMAAAGTGYLAVVTLGVRSATTASRAARRLHP